MVYLIGTDAQIDTIAPSHGTDIQIGKEIQYVGKTRGEVRTLVAREVYRIAYSIASITYPGS